jgi:hypothetical protein
LFAAPGWTTVLPWMPIAILTLAVWYVGTHGGSTALSEMVRANEILERSLVTLRERVDTLERENAELKGRTDVAIAIERSMAAHEVRAQARHEATAVILSLIAQRLGPDVNGGK